MVFRTSPGAKLKHNILNNFPQFAEMGYTIIVDLQVCVRFRYPFNGGVTNG